MTAVIILSALALLLFLKISLHASYGDEGLSIHSDILWFEIKLLPKRKKAKKKKSAASLKKRLELIKVVLKTLDKIKHIIVFDKVRIRYIAAGDDPYNTVREYNAVNAFIGAVIPFFESYFGVKDKEIEIDANMCGERSELEFEIKLSIRICQILYLGLSSGSEVIKLLLSRKSDERDEGKALYGKQTQ